MPKLPFNVKESRCDLLAEHYKKNDLHTGFIEPQSMNYSISISEAYKSFSRKDRNKPEENKKQPSKKLVVEDMDKAKNACGIEFRTLEDQKMPYEETEEDDALARLPRADKLLRKKMKDSHFMRDIRKQAEHWVRDNMDNDDTAQPMVRLDSEGKPKEIKRSNSLSVNQMNKVNQIVEKRIRRARRDVIRDDDENMMD